MAIAFIAATASSSAATVGTAFTVTYSPTNGNKIVLGGSFSGTIGNPTCTDNNANALTLIATAGAGHMVQFYGTASSNPTAYTLNWVTSSKASAILGEYAGPTSSGAVATASATSTTPTVSLIETGANSFNVAVIMSQGNVTFTQATGTLRGQVSAGAGNANSIALVDNSGLSAGNTITCACTVSNTTWFAAGLEIIPPAGGGGGGSNWLGVSLAQGWNKHGG